MTMSMSSDGRLSKADMDLWNWACFRCFADLDLTVFFDGDDPVRDFDRNVGTVSERAGVLSLACASETFSWRADLLW